MSDLTMRWHDVGLKQCRLQLLTRFLMRKYTIQEMEDKRIVHRFMDSSQLALPGVCCLLIKGECPCLASREYVTGRAEDNRQ